MSIDVTRAWWAPLIAAACLAAAQEPPDSRPVEVAGVVRDAQGQPVGAVDLHYQVINADEPRGDPLLDGDPRPWLYATTSDAEGRFRFPARGVRLLPDDAEIVDQLTDDVFMRREPPFVSRVRVRVSARGAHGQEAELALSVHAPQPEPLALALLRPARVSGQLLDAQGQPLPGVSLSCQHPLLPEAFLAHTDDEGFFVLEAAEGDCRLASFSPLWQARQQALTLDPGAPLELEPWQLSRRRAIFVRVPGAARAGALRLRLEREGEPPQERVAFGAGEDLYVWSDPPLGDWRARVSAQMGPLRRHAAGAVRVVEGEHVDLGVHPEWARDFVLDDAVNQVILPRLLQKPEARFAVGSEALESARALLALDPEDGEAHFLYGVAAHFLQDPGGASEAFESARARGYVPAFVQRALTHTEPDPTQADLDLALASDGTPLPFALQERARLRWAAGDEAGALEDLARHHEVEQVTWEVQQGRAWDPMVRGQLLLAELFPDRPQPAAELLERFYTELNRPDAAAPPSPSNPKLGD